MPMRTYPKISLVCCT